MNQKRHNERNAPIVLFLADVLTVCTAYASVVSVSLSSVTLRIVAERCVL